MKHIKNWWNIFKEDLIFNIVMMVLSGILLFATLYLIIFALKLMWNI